MLRGATELRLGPRRRRPGGDAAGNKTRRTRAVKRDVPRGGTRKFLGAIFDLYREVGMEEVQRVVDTGDQYGVVAPHGHHCHMYRWEELKALLERHSCEIVAASAANFLSVQDEAVLEEAGRDPVFWETLLEWESRFCEQSGVLDAGTHIIVVLRRV